ncbi:MAG: sugar phosphate isomerase/epimerase [Lewinellaceae bacterium]|nr:sugar phosphate isomerase/epimerase [Lewinellaceae bacterium]
MLNRRDLLKSLAVLPLLSPLSGILGRSRGCYHLRTSLNAYSFNGPLSKGDMDLFQLVDFCADNDFDAVDITAYYFPEYPKVPDDEFVYRVKQKAFSRGLEISGTGVRNDFTNPDKTRRNEHIQLVKNWIGVAEKLGAPVIRVFAGAGVPEGYSWEQTAEWMVEDFRECAAYGEKHGVMVAVQNHNDFIRTPEHVHYLMKKVDHPWFGLILDIGSYRDGDAYADIVDTLQYAVNWQVKEKLFIRQEETVTDLKKLLEIIKAGCYRGYLPIETLGDGDPAVKVKAMIAELRKYL